MLLHILKVYSDAGNLLLVINSADWEEQYYKSKLDAKYVHEVANTATERWVTLPYVRLLLIRLFCLQ